MTALIVFVPLVLLPMALRRYADSWRGAILIGAVAFAGILAAITEILSALHALTFWPVLACWVLVSFGLMGIVRKKFSGIIACLLEVRKLSRSEILLLGGITAILLVTFAIALFAAPNNYDAMTYHMPRVMHWVQNASVAHYPAVNDRQLFNSPLAEYFIAHFQILAANDHFAAFPQWLAFVGCVIGVSKISQQLGASQRGQIIAGALCAALPMAILQSTSSQNDLVSAFFFVASVSLGLNLVQTRSLGTTLFFGLVIGLGLLTKATTFVFIAPYAAWVFLLLLGHLPIGRWLMAAALTALLTLGINMPHFARNYARFGSPIAPDSLNAEALNQLYSPAAFVSNIVRNLSLHTATPIKSINRAQEIVIRKLHAGLGLSEDDPRTTLGQLDTEKFSVNARAISNNENYAGSQAQLILFLAAILAQLATPRLRKNKTLWAYMLCAALGFALLSLSTKWMPYNARLHLSFFVIISPYIAVVFSQLRWQRMGTALGALVMLISAPWLARNATHPLIGEGNVFVTSRENQMFINAAVFEPSYTSVAQVMAALPCDDFGLRLGGDDWEYPLWVLPRAYGKNTFTLRLADGTNCAVISSAKLNGSPDLTYSEVWRSEMLVIYAKR